MTKISTPTVLQAAYPYQFARPMDRWAFSFARGWLPIIANACKEIDALVCADKYHHRFHWVQIKEKFGTLRLYWRARGMQGMRLDVMTPEGVLSLVPRPKGTGHDAEVAAQISSVVRAAENQSAHTCIVCGSAGTLRPQGWALTLCDGHAAQREQGKRLEISFRSEVFGFDWDSAAIPPVPRRTKHRAVSRFHRDREWWAWYVAHLEGLPLSLPEVQTLASGGPVPGLGAGVRNQVLQIVDACREVERLARSNGEFEKAAAKRILHLAGCEISDETGSGLFIGLPDRHDFENALERALVAFSSLVLGELVRPDHAVRGGLLVAQLVLLSARADPLVPCRGTSAAELAQAIALARESGDATQLMQLLTMWHPDAGVAR